MKIIKFLFVFFVASSLLANVSIIENNGVKYLSNEIVVKFKSQNSLLNKSVSILKQFEKFGIVETVKYVNTKDNGENNPLNRIYRLRFTTPFDPVYVSSKLARNSEVEWAEPLYLREIVYTPNDPSFTSQYALQNIQAEAAWDITKGNSSIILAIVDSGVDWNHEDLSAHIWQNDDPINGVDDDQNGYVDDIRGWDFGGLDGNGDNNPVEDSPTHGTHVAGIASAVTNNSLGVAGIGYSLTIMPVKTSRHDLGDNLIAYGYQGIIYAADNGADIINCSWGGFGYSNAEQEVINYAVEKGAVIVAAAGNDGMNEVIYPAAYNGVLSVGNTDSNDRLSSSSNYGKDLDVCAPGTSIYSTWQNSTSPYIYLSGTSMASPLAAGLAGLVVDKFPNYTPLQIIEQIRVNADNIDGLNSGKEFLLGSGRINAYKAVSNSDVKSVRIVSIDFVETNNPDGIFQSGDEIEVRINFMNYLSPLSAFTADLTTTSGDVTITSSHFSTAAKGTLEEFSNLKQEFKFTINENSGNDKEIFFKLNYSDGDYTDFEYISIYINPTYRTQSGNKVALTITSKGTLGFNDYPTNLQGSGFTYMKGENLLFEAGLMYGNSETIFADAVRGSNTDYQSDDFYPLSFVQINIPGTIADQEAVSLFNDNNAGINKPGIETTLKTYSFSDEGNDDYLILKYLFKNNSGVDYTNFYAGLYFDWDIDGNGYDQNVTKYDVDNNFGYVYHNTDLLPYVGMALLSDGTTGFYGITNDGSDGGIGVYDGFSDASKWTTLTNGLNKTEAGPNDVSSVISAGPFELKADSILEVTFSINAALSLSDLQISVANCREKYKSVITDVTEGAPNLTTEFVLYQNYPNPFNPSTTISYSIPSDVKRETINAKLIVYDVLAREVAVLVDAAQTPGNYKVTFDASNLVSGIYFYKLTYGSYSATKKLMLIK